MRKEIHTITYICDICKKEFIEGKLNKVILPHKHLEATSFQGIGKWSNTLQYSAIEMCDECAKKLNKLISDNFAFIYSADYEPDLRIEKATKEKEANNAKN